MDQSAQKLLPGQFEDIFEEDMSPTSMDVDDAVERATPASSFDEGNTGDPGSAAPLAADVDPPEPAPPSPFDMTDGPTFDDPPGLADPSTAISPAEPPLLQRSDKGSGAHWRRVKRARDLVKSRDGQALRRHHDKGPENEPPALPAGLENFREIGMESMDLGAAPMPSPSTPIGSVPMPPSPTTPVGTGTLPMAVDSSGAMSSGLKRDGEPLSSEGNKRHPTEDVPEDDDDLLVDYNWTVHHTVTTEAEQHIFSVHEAAWDDLMLSAELEFDSEKALRHYCQNPQAFAAQALKKGRGEVKVAKLDDQQRAVFAEARKKEVDQFLSKGAIKLVRMAGVPEDRIMRMRFVQTWKSTGQAKARLVLLGFTDPDLTAQRSDAPTVSKRGKMIFLQSTAHLGWKSEKADVIGAFLQAENTEELRNVFGLPPDELLEAMHCKHLRGQVLVQILKPVYGLTVAPRRWWQQVCKDLGKLQWIQCQIEPCYWYLLDDKSTTRKLIGMIVVHVDDFLISGDPHCNRFHQARQELLKLYEWQPWEHTSFEQTGCHVEQLNNAEFRLSQPTYADGVAPVTVDRARRNRLEQTTSDGEKTGLRALCGAVLWRASQAAPWLSVVLSFLLSEIPRSTVATLLEANKLLRSMRRTSALAVRIFAFKRQKIGFVGYCDASWASRPDGSSHGGYICFAVSVDYFTGVAGPMVPISWSSHKLTRICRSSLAAEIQGMSSCQDELDYCRLLWHEVMVGPINLENPAEAIAAVDGGLVSDCRSFYDAVNKKESSGLGLKDKRAAIEGLSIRQHCVLTKTPVYWCNSDAQLADGLTKPAAAYKLEEFFDKRGQSWRLTFDAKIMSAKKRRALGLGPIEDAIEQIAPTEMLQARQSDEQSPVTDSTGTVAMNPAPSIKRKLQSGKAFFLDW